MLFLEMQAEERIFCNLKNCIFNFVIVAIYTIQGQYDRWTYLTFFYSELLNHFVHFTYKPIIYILFMRFITKTLYLRYISCAKDAWLQINKPELKELFELSDFDKSLVAKGNLVESWARKLFPGGILVEEFGEEGHEVTGRYLNEKKQVIFQSTFTHDKFLVRNDVLEYDDIMDCWNIYEIKGTNTLDENENCIDHIEDASFQCVVLGNIGVKIGRVFLVHLNKEYVRGEEIDVQNLFVSEDITDKVNDRMEVTRQRMELAANALFQADESDLECKCIYHGRSNHCTTFSYSHPHVPEYSVHDLSRIGSSKKKLASLIEAQIFDIKDIPESFVLTQVQENQVNVHKHQKTIIDLKAIENELQSLIYPLYFLDYETYPAAIPLFKGFKPYQQTPFQFSLHVLSAPNGELEHYEYLHMEATDPTEHIIAKLKEMIGPKGSIIVWSKRFEKGINAHLAERSPKDKEFLEDVNNRIYDLMEIFQKQFYVHPGFKGRVRIKKVLPVMVPELSYKVLEIQEGGAAMEAWFEMIFNCKSDTEKQKVAENLLKYCCLDTYAMYAIWKKLMEIDGMGDLQEKQES